MKKAFISFSFITLALCFVFTACSGIGGKNTETSASYVASGKISLSGAAPAINANHSSSERTAYPSMTNETFASDSFKITVYKKDSDGAYVTDENSTAAIDVSTMEYSVVFKETGDYKIECSLFDDVYKGDVEIEVSDDKTSYELDNLVLQFISKKSTLTGEVDLNFYDSSKKVKSVSYKGIVKTKAETGVTVYNSMESGYSDFNADGEAEIYLSSVYANCYEVIFTFTDAQSGEGNTLYECKEIVNVLPGFTTDTWYGSAGTGTHISRENKTTPGAGEFIITDSLIEKFGTELVPNTQYAIYTYDETEGINKYYLVDNIEAVNLDNSTINTLSSENSFCFDDNGYFYALTKRGEDHCKIYSNNPVFGEINNSLINGDLGSLIAVDRKTGLLYVLDSSNSDIYQITQDDGSYSYNETLERYTCAKTISYSSDENQSYISDSTAFIVNDGIAYFGSADDDSLTIVDLSDVTPEESEGYYGYSGSESISLGLSELEKTEEAIITDMIYQDGYVYILFKDCFLHFGDGVNNFAMSSRGAIFRYSLFDRTVSGPLGWTDVNNGTVFKYGDQAEENEKFLPSYNGYPVGYSDQEDSVRPDEDLPVQLASAFTSGSGRPTYGIHSIAVETPLLSDLDSQFCGPQKFVAVKPKKLVIADSGIAFYTDADGVWKYKNINRIVMVDLNSFMLDSNYTDSPTVFNTKTTKVLSLLSSDYEAAMSLSGHKGFFHTSGGSYYSCSTAYAGITNGDD